jgi:hypothetical protein
MTMVNYVQRARDVRLLIKQDGVERGLIKAVERLSEDNEMLRQEMAGVVKTVDMMANIVADISTVGAKLKNEFMELQKKFRAGIGEEQ